MSKPLCRHCRQRRVARPRGLCVPCFYEPGVRDLYPSTSKFARCGVRDFNGRTALPATATRCVAGTPGKVEVMVARAAAGTSLWHPDDEEAA